MKELAKENITYASKYLATVEKIISVDQRKFDNDLLYNMISMAFEKFMVGHLANLDQIAGSHLPLMLYREVKMVDKVMPEEHKDTAILVGKFEAICSLDGFGYHTPTDAEILQMISGLKELEEYVSN